MRGVARLPVMNSVPLAPRATRDTVIMHRGHGRLVRRMFHSMHAGVRCVLRSKRGMVLFASAASNRNGDFGTNGLTYDFTFVNGGMMVIKLSVHGPKLGGIFRLSRGRTKVSRCLSTPRRASLLDLYRTSAMSPGLCVLPNNAVPPGPARLITHRTLSSTVRRLGTRFSCIVLSATPVNVMASARLVTHMTSLDICMYHSGCATGDRFGLVGRLRRSNGLPRLYMLVGNVSVGGHRANSCCNCNGCNGCKRCNCKGGCNCNCNCNCKRGGWLE